MKHINEWDQLIDILLLEELRGETPPDLSAKIFAKTSKASFNYYSWLRPLAAACLFGFIFILVYMLYPSTESKITGEYTLINTSSLQRGAEIHAKGKGATLSLGGYVDISLKGDTKIKLSGNSKNESIFLIKGEALCSVNQNIGKFVVVTDLGKVSVKGTKFIVKKAEKPTEKLYVKVISGTVLLSSIWGNSILNAGDEKTVKNDSVKVLEHDKNLNEKIKENQKDKTSLYSEKKFKISFVDENEKPILKGKFYLYQYKNGEFVKHLYRHHKLTEGFMLLDDLPEEGMIGFTSEDKYYEKSIEYKKSIDITKGKKELKFKIQKSGIIKVIMTQNYFKTKGPFVVPFFRHKNGETIHAGGYGIFLKPNTTFEITGLQPGIYHIEIKDSYEKNATQFYRSAEVDVRAGKTVTINGVELTDLVKYRRENDPEIKYETKTEHYDNGIIKFKGEFVNGVPHGPMFKYHKNGKVWMKGNYKNGDPDGIQKIYYPSGKIQEECYWKNGRLEGKATLYDSNGDVKMIKEYFKGELIRTDSYENGKLVKSVDHAKDNNNKPDDRDIF